MGAWGGSWGRKGLQEQWGESGKAEGEINSPGERVPG